MAQRRRRRHRQRRATRRRATLLTGLGLIVASVVLALGRAFDHAGLFEKWFGWSALRSFTHRALDALSSAPLLVGLLLVGGTLLLVGLLSRK